MLSKISMYFKVEVIKKLLHKYLWHTFIDKLKKIIINIQIYLVKNIFIIFYEITKNTWY